MTPNHFSDPMLSCWQAAVAAVAHGSDFGPASLAGGLPLRDASHEMVGAATVAAHAQATTPGQGPSVLEGVAKCASMALEIGLAQTNGDMLRVAELRSAFEQYGSCDLRWIECVQEFNRFYNAAKTNKAYKRWEQPSDFVEDSLPAQCRIGVIGDWGTGEPRAQAVLRQIARHEPHILLHLGDIYYACTQQEAELFYQNTKAALPDARVLTLCGNHDMYSGGVPYQNLLRLLGQPASFFCLRNRWWQLLAADTGYNDFDPGSQGSIATWVQDHDGDSDYSELAWHKDKLDTAGARRTILLSHHQPFTRNTPIEGKAVNERLLGQFSPYLAQIPLWLWGHEHNQVIYGPFRGVERGRCVGASAVPTPGSEDPYEVPEALAGQEVPSLVDDPMKLALDPRLGLYNLGYAILELDQANGRASYFQYDTSRDASIPMHEEAF